MIDFELYYLHCPAVFNQAPIGSLKYSEDALECRCSVYMQNLPLSENQKLHYDEFKATDTRRFEDTQFLLCPLRVLGYHLSSKKWVELSVLRVREIENKIT
jgi:hypothetical protein